MASLFFLPFPAQLDFWNRGSGRGEEPGGEKGFPPDSDPFGAAELPKISVARQAQLQSSTSRLVLRRSSPDRSRLSAKQWRAGTLFAAQLCLPRIRQGGTRCG